ncbi:hypothetical protein EKG40_03565 [Pseudomonas moorei]|nr:hypothetical protein EKG40_03565 [Pseudomonas moorei]
MTYVTLSLDFKNANAVREKAYDFFAEEQWEKLENVDTVWMIEYPSRYYNDSEDVRKIHYNIASTLKKCAKDLDIERINYIIQVGNRKPIQRQVVYQHGEYKEGAYVKP